LYGFFGTTLAVENGYVIGTWNVSCLYRAGVLKTVESELAKYTFDLVAVQEVR
jgi:hypothetical protein